MIGHRRWKELLAVRETLSPAEIDELEAHLQGCDACRATAAEYRRQDAFLQGLRVPEAPFSLREGVVDRLGQRRRSRARRRQPAPAALSWVAALLVVGAAGLLYTHVRGQTRGTGEPPPAAGQGVPPAATELARKLGVQGPGVVGNQPQGEGRPWAVWFLRTIKPGWVGPGNVPRHFLPLAGPALFASLNGAHGEFHYFNPGPLTASGGDSYRGPAMTRDRALRLALAWLHKAGVSTPQGTLRVQVRPGTTWIGGTGLCCYRSLGVVTWGGHPDGFGDVTNAPIMVYVADAGTVVQADIGRRLTPSFTPSSCRGSTDRNGVPLGRWCFDYPSAAWLTMVADIGGHGPWRTDPDQMAAVPTTRGDARGRIRRISLTATRAVYEEPYKGITYRMTLVPAFPGLVGSVWELVRVEHVAPAQPAEMRTVCSGSNWRLVGPGRRIASPQSFVSSGGELIPSALRRIHTQPHAEYWVTKTDRFMNTCNGWGLSVTELGVNRKRGTYLYMVKMALLPPNISPPIPLAPPRPCVPAQRTHSMGRVILPSRFRADIADFPRLKPNLGDLLPTSAWQTVQKKLYLTVFAGQSRRQAGHGEIEVIRSGSCQLGPVTVDTTDQRTGPLRLTGVRGNLVSFTYAGGRGTLSLRTHTFSYSHQS